MGLIYFECWEIWNYNELKKYISLDSCYMSEVGIESNARHDKLSSR